MDIVFRHSFKQTDTIWSFVFDRPSSFVWVAGQSVKLEIAGVYGPLEHRFTIASIPADNSVVVTTRLSSSMYKRKLQQLQLGDMARAYAVEGTFVWGESRQRRCFVAVGIGVTPFYSMVRQRLADNALIPATLIYGTPDSQVLYKDFFDEVAATNPDFTVHYIAGRRITAKLVAEMEGSLEGLVYVAGPGAMVDSVSDDLLADYGLPAQNLLRDWYSGNLPTDG